MKKLLLAMAFALLCGLQLIAQESSVKILLDDEERFRFDSIRLEFINSGHHVMIGDSTGMNNAANSLSIENTFIGHRAGSIIQSGEYNTPESGDYNTFLGARAGENHVRGPENLFLGVWAGRYDSAGGYNTYVGPFAGYINKTGFFNTIIGYSAGAFGSSGSNNVFIGRETGLSNKSGQLNAFVGTNAGYRNNSGSENTFLGTSAGGYNKTGNNNTYLGRRAGRYNETGSGNVFLGYYAGAFEMDSNKLYIANSDTIDPLIYGEFDNKILRFNAGRIEMRNPGGNIFIGDSVAYLNTSGNGNVYIGNLCAKNDSAGNYNVYLGSGSGQSNKSGHRNVFLGVTCGLYNTTGQENVFVGTSAGAYNTSGSFNICVGRRAGQNNQTGSGNVFLGYYAGSNELNSNKLYIANSDTSDPLIYGEFDNEILKFNANSVQTTGKLTVSGEIRSDQYFNAGGLQGISDTINTVTAIDFTRSKLKYRTTIYTGGIVTYISLESVWVDAVGEFIFEEEPGF